MNKKILKAIIVLLVLIVAIVLALIILKNPTENNNTINEEENLGQQEEKEVIRLGQSFSAKAGTYIIVKEGNVYYIPNYSITNAQELARIQGIATYGYYNTKEVYVPNPMPENEEDLGNFYGYKLELENIKLGYKFNTENEEHIIFIDTTGNISELSYKIATANKENSDETQLDNIKL